MAYDAICPLLSLSPPFPSLLLFFSPFFPSFPSVGFIYRVRGCDSQESGWERGVTFEQYIEMMDCTLEGAAPEEQCPRLWLY